MSLCVGLAARSLQQSMMGVRPTDGRASFQISVTITKKIIDGYQPQDLALCKMHMAQQDVARLLCSQISFFRRRGSSQHSQNDRLHMKPNPEVLL